MDKVYKFSDFILDKKSITLYHNNSPVQLSSRAFEMLLYLVEKRGYVVEKDEILDKVWKDSFVEEANLPVHISALRRVLQEKKGESRFIKTISGRGYSFIAEVEEVKSNQTTNQKNTNIIENKNFSIAVLPFTIENSSEDNEYLANGITQSLISDLSTIQDLRVLAHSAVKPYKNSDLELQEIGFLLNADKILTGIITEYKSKWEISAELVNAQDKSCLWATNQTFEADDIFEVKKQISSEIVEKLKLKLIGKSNESKEINSEAQKLYYRGKFVLESRTAKKIPKEVLQQALRFFQAAIKIEPTYALAYVGIGSVYVSLYNLGLIERKKALLQAQKALQMAFKIDDNISEVYVLQGSIASIFDLNFTKAEKILSKSLALAPNNPNIYYWLSGIFLRFANFSRSVEFGIKAVELDPTSLSFSENLTRIFYFAGEYEKAIIQAKELLEFNEKTLTACLFSALSYAHLGIFDLAIKNIESAYVIRPIPEILLNKIFILGLFGKVSEAKKIFENEIDTQSPFIDFTDIASFYTVIDDKESAFKYLEKAYKKKSPNLSVIKIDIRFKNLWNEPRFDRLLQKLNLK